MGGRALGDLEQSVMLTLARLGESAYGVSVRNELAQWGRSLSFGTIYAVLDRLEDKGMVTSRTGDPTPERGGRAKRYYRLTAKGEQTLSAAIDARRALERGISLVGVLSPRRA